MYKHIIFDLGNVLINWDPDRVYLPYFNDKDKVKAFYQETDIFNLNAQMDKGLSFDTGLHDLAAKFPHYQEPIMIWKSRWPDMLGGLIDKNVAILEKLYIAGHTLYALTNWSQETFPYVYNKYDFFRKFRDIVVSGEVNLIKPEPEIYQLLLQRNHLKPGECLFIDDNENNVRSAIDLGIASIKLESTEQLIKSLNSFGICL